MEQSHAHGRVAVHHSDKLMKINEIAHLRIGFAQLDEGPVNRSERNFAYSIQEAQRRTVLFVLEEKNGKQYWSILDDDMPCSFERPKVYAYMSGPVFEAERGQRLVNGRVLNAESYIRYLKSVPTTDLTALKGARLTIDMWVRIEDERKLMHDDWFGWTFDPALKTVVEDGFIKVSIPVVNQNNLLLAFFGPWSGKDRFMHLDLTQVDPIHWRAPVSTPLVRQTADLF